MPVDGQNQNVVISAVPKHMLLESAFLLKQQPHATLELLHTVVRRLHVDLAEWPGHESIGECHHDGFSDQSNSTDTRICECRQISIPVPKIGRGDRDET